jgi:hypothetical protein
VFWDNFAAMRAVYDLEFHAFHLLILAKYAQRKEDFSE